MISMPANVHYYNGASERCDLIDGPCGCGAWHKVDEWESRISKALFQTDRDRRNCIEAIRAAITDALDKQVPALPTSNINRECIHSGCTNLVSDGMMKDECGNLFPACDEHRSKGKRKSNARFRALDLRDDVEL